MKRKLEISPKQQRLIACLVTERTVDGACRKAKVAVSTYWRWMKDETFVREYRQARRDIFENTTAQLPGLTQSAIDTLERNLSCGNPSVETRTAAIILEQAFKGFELFDLEQRLEALECLVDSKEVEL